MCTELDDYSVQIDAEYYDNDYDIVDIENQSEPVAESDILFE